MITDKNAYTLLFFLFSFTLTFGQNITLLKNYNPKAQELKHNLNKTKDSLILGCEKTIVKVDIFNEDYEKTILVENINTIIPLEDLPIGKFIVEASLNNKIITMNLIKYNNYKVPTSSDRKEVASGKEMMLDETLNTIKKSPNMSVEYIFTLGKTKKSIDKKKKFYWTITKTSNEIGSSKIMKLANQDSVDRMILKNKSERNSPLGKENELIVWEVYNTSKFMKHQTNNPDYVYTASSEIFNTTPYYSTENNIK